MSRLLLTSALLLLLGCPELEPPPTADCKKAYEKCKLPDGPLGVCEVVDCAAEQKGPCYRCTSQH